MSQPSSCPGCIERDAVIATLRQRVEELERQLRDLQHRLEDAGYRVEHTEYFNLGGIPGWWLTGRVLRRTLIPQASLRLFDALVPLFRCERFLPWRLGQSLIAVGVRP